MATFIPLHKPFYDEHEIKSAAKVIRSGNVAGNGPVCKAVEDQLRRLTGTTFVFLTPSCTHAMELALMALGVRDGDEVILPSFTFTSTCNSVVLRGAAPVFADITEDTLNLDPIDIKTRMTLRTRVIMPVHYAGVSCEMDRILEIAQSKGCYVVEDAAQGIGASYKSRALGTLGDIGCLSFHVTKNVTCGEGGALLTNSKEIAAKVETIREKGTNRSAFLRKEVDKYTWVSAGSSYILSDILAAILQVQLTKLETITGRRRQIYERYLDELEPLERRGLLRLPRIPRDCKPNYHIFYVLLRDLHERIRVQSRLRSKGIEASFHFVPLHSSPFGKQFGSASLRVTTAASERLLRLPIYPGLTQKEQEHVIAAITLALKES